MGDVGLVLRVVGLGDVEHVLNGALIEGLTERLTEASHAPLAYPKKNLVESQEREYERKRERERVRFAPFSRRRACVRGG